MNKKALIITWEKYQDHEVIYPYYRVQEEGFEVDIMSNVNGKIFGILGNNGGKVKKCCKDQFIVSSKNSSRIQEIHIIFWQTVCEIVENNYANKKR